MGTGVNVLWEGGETVGKVEELAGEEAAVISQQCSFSLSFLFHLSSIRFPVFLSQQDFTSPIWKASVKSYLSLWIFVITKAVLNIMILGAEILKTMTPKLVPTLPPRLDVCLQSVRHSLEVPAYVGGLHLPQQRLAGRPEEVTIIRLRVNHCNGFPHPPYHVGVLQGKEKKKKDGVCSEL